MESLSDFTKIIYLLGAINVLIIFSWAIKKYFSFLPNYIPRKFLHVTAISVAAISFVVISDQNYLLVLGLLILGGNYLLVKKGVFEDEDKNRKNYGVFFVPISYLILVWLLNDHRTIAMFSMLIMAFSDGLAALFGIAFPVLPYRVGKSKKTALGSFVFFSVTFLIFLISLPSLNEAAWFIDKFSQAEIVITAIYFSFLLTLVEAISYNGFDNLFVPLLAAALYLILFASGAEFQISAFIYAFVFVLFVAALSFKAKFLSNDGLVASSIVGLIIFGLGGIKWATPLLVFFFTSSILSKLHKVSSSHFEKGGKRDAIQVFANGGLPVAFLLLSFAGNPDLFYFLYLISLAVSSADTWATEIGNLFYQKTLSIINFREIEQGISGGVSLLGSLGGLLGAATLMVSGIFWIPNEMFGLAFLIIVFGFFGMTVDSLLGALWQRKNICVVCKKITEKSEHCGKPTEFAGGVKWLNNDGVNFASELISSALFYFIYTNLIK